MARNRAEDIEQDSKTSKGGKAQTFYYVDLKKAERSGLDGYKSEDGDNFIRFLPPDDSERLFGRRIFFHNNIGPNRKTILCAKRTHDKNNEPMGEDCPICELATKLWEADNQDARAKALFAKERWLYYIVNSKDDSTIEKGPMWFDAPKQFQGEIRALSIKKRGGGAIDISDPENGRDFCYTRSGKGIETKYEGFQLLDSEPIPKDWYEGLPLFDDILLWTEKNEILELISSVAPDVDGEEEQPQTIEKEESPSSGRRMVSRRSLTTAKKIEAETEIEEESGEDEVVDDDNSEDSKPSNPNPATDVSDKIAAFRARRAGK